MRGVIISQTRAGDSDWKSNAAQLSILFGADLDVAMIGKDLDKKLVEKLLRSKCI